MYAPFSQTVALFLDWQAKEMGCGLQAGRAMLAESHRLCKFHHVVDLMASVKAGKRGDESPYNGDTHGRQKDATVRIIEEQAWACAHGYAASTGTLCTEPGPWQSLRHNALGFAGILETRLRRHCPMQLSPRLSNTFRLLPHFWLRVNEHLLTTEWTASRNGVGNTGDSGEKRA
ncbi:hypothetical protein AK812_SmicGene11520 [Symbiodinium microadriaticum]|uniref:Uncharacterized protein n=1 Tax=Symbiodinium microadriaticum TaxID=2951 RepID=A0A1Q9ED67_SYMMI|nr:hypothetical protein AK812_SmicGene11520 [Symbiodinium microadriaticum]